MYDDLIKRLRDIASHDSRIESNYIGLTLLQAADAIEAQDRHILTLQHEMMAEAESHTALVERLSKQNKKLEEAVKTALDFIPCWIPVTERLPECDLGAEVGNIEWISCGMVYSGCFGRGGKYRDAYFRTWADAGEGIDAKDADYWRAVALPEPPKEE